MIIKKPGHFYVKFNSSMTGSIMTYTLECWFSLLIKNGDSSLDKASFLG